jgi:hypothetical protein
LSLVTVDTRSKELPFSLEQARLACENEGSVTPEKNGIFLCVGVAGVL